MKLGIGIIFATAWLCSAAQAQDAKGGLNDFLADTSGSYVGAAGIIGLDGQVVRDTSSPKEFVASVNAIRRKDAKDGVGVAFTPGRARFEQLVVDMGKLTVDAEKSMVFGPAKRLWGATTFSYAQKRGDVDGAGEHRFWAYAVNTEYYWKFKDDPAVAAYKVFIGSGTAGATKGANSDDVCARARSLTGNDASKLQDGLKQLRVWHTESAAALAKAESDAAQKSKDAKKAAETADEVAKAKGTRDSNADAVAAAASAASSAAGSKKDAADKEQGSTAAVEKAVTDCIKAASQAAVEKWNAPKLTLLWGQGYIQSTAAASSRYSLGNHLQLAASISPGHWSEKKEKDNYLKNGLLTVSYKRSTNAVDTTTLAGTPVFNSQSLFAARYTHAFGGKEDSPIAKAGSTDGGINTYVLAEFSTAKSNTGGVAAGTYKQALGVDYRLGANMWLELRHGRAVAQTGDKYETKSMLTLKLSPETALAALMPKP